MIGEMIFESPWRLLLAQGTACLAVGLAASCVLRHRAARAHQVLLTALLASVLMPALYLFVGHFGFGLLASTMTPAAQEAIETQPLDAPLLADLLATEAAYEPMPVSDEPAVEVPAYHVATTRVPWDLIGVACWTAVATALLIRLTLRFLLGLHVVHTARPLENERLCRALQAAKSRLGISRPVGIRCSEKVCSPVIWCWGRGPVLLVHASACHSRDSTDWVGVFCHELSHWKRFDHLSGLAAEVLTAVFPWHPLLWWAQGRLLRLSEQACDDWVLASGQVGVDYAESLLGLLPAGQAAFVPTIIGKEEAMKERIRRIVKNECDNPRIGVRWAMGVSALAVLASVGAALAQERPAARERREEGQRPQVRQEQAAPRPAVAGRRNVLTRLRDQLQEQARDTEAAIRQRGDDVGPEGRVLRAELDTLREQIELVEQQLRNLEGGPRRANQAQPRPPELEARVNELRRHREELAELQRETGEPFEGRGRAVAERQEQWRAQVAEVERQLQERKERHEGDSPESRELLERLRVLREELRAAGDMRAPQEQPATTRSTRRIPDGGESRTEVRVFKLRQARPEQLRDVLQPVLGRSGQIAVDERTNSLIVTTTPENMARVESTIREFDVPAGNRNLEAEVEELQSQMNGLREQMQQMRKLLEQAVERGQMDRPAR
jgi:beta-lactamase regulating signal transducer with metallopeptidase domain/predicted  nucleic acid-binding Zn-ribbon protein